jgi:hypothetical protein
VVRRKIILSRDRECWGNAYKYFRLSGQEKLDVGIDKSIHEDL